MREGISRDGHHLYPAHPYTAFTKTSDADLQALYAYLMAQPPVEYVPPETLLRFPYGLRFLMAGWNALFLRPGPYQPNLNQSAEWNRGAYLVEGLGHCGACHTPRNGMGAERSNAHFAGAFAEGWEAPPLSALSHAPIPWTEAALFDYLRTGFSRFHGPAAGPMAPVISELLALPDDDIRAMAVYLSSLSGTEARIDEADLAIRLEKEAHARASTGVGARIYEGACAVCHETGTGPTLFGTKPSLALNSNLYSASPDNLIQVVLNGITNPAHSDLGYMPAFRDSLNDWQVGELVAYLRKRFAGEKPAWTDLESHVARIRMNGH
jgi:nicotinate dehydrogenase subunit B